MLVIGFANNFYTLWNCIETLKGQYSVKEYTFLKNIATDLDKAKQLHPDALIDLSVKGHSRFERKSVEQNIAPDKFTFGKYTGTNIKDCNDFDYIEWYMNATSDKSQRETCENTLIDKAGYVKHGDNLLSKQQYEIIEAQNREANNLYTLLNEQGYIEFKFDRNIELVDNVAIYRNLIVTFEFAGCKEMSYQGFRYYLPTVKGKAVRIKNKNVKVFAESFYMDKHNHLHIKCGDLQIIK